MNLMQLHEPGETPAPHEGEATLAVGIDLGTTHSVVAVSRGGAVEVLRDAEGEALVPSVVAYREGLPPLVGKAARDAAGDVVASIKRLMGRGGEDITPLLGQLPYNIVEGDGPVRIHAGGKERTAVEISADILRHLKGLAGHALGQDVSQAVITVPAYFDDAARLATKDAARLAGLEVLRLVSEPTAAALAYGLDKGAEGIYAVYDLGGGTFDISLLKLEQGVFQVLATAGDTQLGGDDMDRAIVEHVCRLQGVASLEMAVAAQWLAQARMVKEKLSEENVGDINGYMLTRQALEALAEPLVARTIAVCGQALSDARLRVEEIKGVVLVGGSTRMPLVRLRVGELFGKEPLTDAHPDEVVAAGAAIQAEGLTRGSDNLLLDVIPLSLGLETMGGLCEKLIERNTPIPVSVAQEFTTYQDGQTGMKFHIVQGEREMAGQNRSLARFELTGIPPLPGGIARIKVNFAVDADGLLTVSASEETTGVSQVVHVRPAYGLPPEEIERMLLESMQHAREDITGRLLVEARVEAQRLLNELDSAMARDGDLLSPQEKRLIEIQSGYVLEAIAGDDRDRIDVEVQQLGQMTQSFAERRMDRAVAGALKGKKINEVDG